MSTDPLREAAARWIDDDPDPRTRAELAAVLAGLPGTAADLADRFAGPLTFGTAGLRGPVRAGPNGMNRAVVRAAAAGLLSTVDGEGPLLIGYDGRHGSVDFAMETARVCTGVGRRALVLPAMLPTPVLAFAVRELGAAAGVMVTASHNPKGDNGYKVYLGDGAQIVPPFDARIEAAIRAVGPLADVPLGPPGETLGGDIVDAYLTAIVSTLDTTSARDLTVAYTAMHGVGGNLVERAFARAGFPPPRAVPGQHEPDPDFPTVAFPNPEEPGAMDLVCSLAESVDADIAIANDPDADRCGAAIRDGNAWRVLRGDEIGVLLADHLMRRGKTGTYATTIVSSSQLRAMAAARSRPYAETLTGFKWIVRAAPDLAFGYEEALGFAVAPQIVRDKDGISAALMLAELAAGLRAEGATVADRLRELAATYGHHATDQVSVRVSERSLIRAAMARLRADIPTTLAGRSVTEHRDLLPDADVVILRADGLRMVVRPSGTEPKLKAYLEAVGPDSAELLSTLRAETIPILGLGT